LTKLTIRQLVDDRWHQMRFRSLRQMGPWLGVLDLIALRGFLADIYFEADRPAKVYRISVVKQLTVPTSMVHASQMARCDAFRRLCCMDPFLVAGSRMNAWSRRRTYTQAHPRSARRRSRTASVSGRGSNMGLTRLGCHNQDAVFTGRPVTQVFLGFRKTAAAKSVRL
jgi:hypothetical protein